VTRRAFDPDLFEPLAQVEPRSFWFRARNRLIVSAFRRHFPNARSFLEVGCGSGVVLEALREALPGVRLVGSDLYSEALDIARRRLDGVELVELDARALPFDEEFDVVGAFDVVEHIDEDELVLSQLHRAVRRGGGALVLVPQHRWLWSEHDRVAEHRRRYARRELVEKMRRVGFDVVETTSFVASLLPVMIASRIADRLRNRSYDPVACLDPGPFNTVFERMLDGERRLIERGVSLPFGGSLMLVGRRR
jgi:SAM-dependent methyltransferase